MANDPFAALERELLHAARRRALSSGARRPPIRRRLANGAVLAVIMAVSLGLGAVLLTASHSPRRAVAQSQGPGLGSAEYPPPVRARGGALSTCPNPAGLVPFTPSRVASAERVARRYGNDSLQVDLRNSDRAWWSNVRRMWNEIDRGQGLDNHALYHEQQGPRIAYASIAAFSCGRRLITNSLTIEVGPRQDHPPYCNACMSTLFFLYRGSRPLVYYVY